MNLKEVRKVVGQIRSTLFKNSNSFSIGMLKSHFRGTGLQFKEHQVYTHGDDVRFIDWKILAKTNVPYVKTFDEERNVEIVVVIDAGPTMLNGYKNVSKLQASIEIACLLYLLAKETNDSVHCIIVTDEVINIPRKSGEEGIAYLISALERHGVYTEEGKVNLEYHYKSEISDRDKQNAIMKHLGRKRELVILSDFNEFLDHSILRRMIFRANVHCFNVVSPLDEAENVPYSFHAQSKIGSDNGSLVKVDLSGKKDLIQLLGKKVKKLRVKDRYLEEFIKGML